MTCNTAEFKLYDVVYTYPQLQKLTAKDTRFMTTTQMMYQRGYENGYNDAIDKLTKES